MEIYSASYNNLPKILRYNQENETRTSKIKWFSPKSSNLHEYDLETKEETIYKHNVPDFFISWSISTCLLPGDNVFCCSSSSDWEFEYDIAFIIDRKNDIQIIQDFSLPIIWSSYDTHEIVFTLNFKDVLITFPQGLASFGSAAIYYNNFVYVPMKKYIIGFDLVNKRWNTLIKGDKDYSWCSVVLFNSMILALDDKSNDIYVIDPLILSISSRSLQIKIDKLKILFSLENVVFLVDSYGKLLESEVDEPFKWKLIRDYSTLLYRDVCSNSAFYNNCWYILVNDLQVYRFDLNQKSFEKADIFLSLED